MDTLKTILVAIDFSACSADAFRQAARIAAENDAALSALHVVDIALFAPLPDPVIPIPLPAASDFVADAREAWTRFAPDLPAKAAATFTIETGSPRQVITDRAHRDHPDLLVLGAHGHLDARRGVGVTAAACLQRTRTRTLVVQPGRTGPFRTVLACVDFTETSLAALDSAVRTAALDDAALHVIHAYNDPWPGSPPPQIAQNMPDFAARYAQAVQERLRDFCKPLTHELTALKATFHAERSIFGPGFGIVSYAERTACDLVVLGTRAKWNVRDFLWGSTAERVAREAHCSILGVPPPETP